ncbi:MAG: translesion error-prone DNA polymerase V autoproteolytic subunit [Rhodospirillales bacterium]|nr:translesion error-prone DNA polymerase V autoproteolytic subunit [Rhodospirillales bacterium]
MVFAADISAGLLRPLFASRVPAGFPSPAEDFVEGTLDLNRHLIDHPVATFFLRVSGDSMVGAGIFADDLLIVDRSLTAKSNDIVIAVLHGELTVKRLIQEKGRWLLRAENPQYPDFTLPEDAEIWGVVTNAIRDFR